MQNTESNSAKITTQQDSKIAQQIAANLIYLEYNPRRNQWCSLRQVQDTFTNYHARLMIDEELREILPGGFSMTRLNTIEKFLRMYLLRP